MEIFDYQLKATDTAIYPESGTGHQDAINYVALGLAGEAGETANLIKKSMRDGPSADKNNKLREEIGDALWYMAMLCNELGFNLDELAQENLTKLSGRQERGTLGGSGTR